MAIHLYGENSIEQRETDNYVDLGAITESYGKNLAEYIYNREIQLYSENLSLDTGIRVKDLLKYSGKNQERCWGHPLLGVRIAEAISTSYSNWCRGKFEVKLQKVYKRESLVEVAVAINIINTRLPNNPGIAKVLIDLVLAEEGIKID